MGKVFVMEGSKRQSHGSLKNSPPLVSVSRGNYLGPPLRVSSKRLHPTRGRLCGDRSATRIIPGGGFSFPISANCVKLQSNAVCFQSRNTKASKHKTWPDARFQLDREVIMFPSYPNKSLPLTLRIMV